MAIVAACALALMSQASTVVVMAPAEEFDVGYRELLAGEDIRAIEVIEANTTLRSDDPALLINKGIALAREGRFGDARTSFKAAVTSRDRFELETATGEWVDSHTLARHGLAMIDNGEFARQYALSMR